MTIEQLIEYLKNYEPFMKQVAAWYTIPAKLADYAPYPEDIDERIRGVYVQRGIEKLYSHQRSAYDAVQRKENIVVVTPTASGKTLCYNLPVLNFMAKHPDARALYLFPTKALSQDQLSELQDIMKLTGLSIKTYTFDGDTPQSARKAIRTAGNIVITNPDMLHSGILPHHTIWVKLFENLQYVVVDEIHTYKGVFGSHFANLIRRLKRICSFYGSNPQFICCSATIANPKELAEKLFEMPFTVIDNNGAPRGKKHFVIYNPPVVDQALGIRASAVKEAAKVGSLCVKNNVSTIIFCRSRLRVEIIATYLKEQCAGFSVAAYRGGYLPNERRHIEKGLREKKINAVVSTNALELGIDIGMLDCAISVGYPGSIASLQQQSGRAGRRGTDSMAIMVATSSPLDQYIANNPHFVFENNPEMASINPDNLLILMDHIKCAAFEIPFAIDELFTPGHSTTREMLEYLAQRNILKESGGKFHWMSDIYPANDISLRSASHDNVVIVHKDNHAQVIGQIDLPSAPTMIHDDAIYIHQGQQYYIDKLDWERRIAYCHEVESDYYTDAEEKTDIHVLEEFESKPLSIATLYLGEVNVRTKAIMFKKIKFGTHENVGWGKINLPELEMHSTSMWCSFNDEVLQNMEREEAGEVFLGLSYILRNIAPLYTLSDYADIRVVFENRSHFTNQPSIFIYDAIPGGVGISERIYHIFGLIAQASKEAIAACTCSHGCPACIGPMITKEGIKEKVIALLETLHHESEGQTQHILH